MCNRKVGVEQMNKTVVYLYPDDKKAASLKVFQDRTNQITGFYFTRDSIKDVEKLPNVNNCAIYFLFNNSEEDESRVYVGQSVNGVARIKDHVANKEFWSFCIMFVTDNSSFDKLTIDYLEFKFISKFKQSSYTLANKDNRNNEPNFSIFDKPDFDSYVSQIEFLLSTEGVVTIEPSALSNSNKYYYPSNKNLGKLYVRDGKFVLTTGSVIRRPKESTKNYAGGFYTRINKLIDDYLEDEKVIETGDGLVTVVDLAFDRPSRPAVLLAGNSQNGWTFFNGLNDLRAIKY